MSTIALLLAAGESTRMGRPKALLPWAGTTLVEWQVAQLRHAGCETVIVVVGSHGDEVGAAAEHAGATIVLNPAFKSGRASSVRTGAGYIAAPLSDALEPVAQTRIVIINVDQPRPAWVTGRLLAASRRSNAATVSPTYRGRGGHPLVLDGRLLKELLEVQDETLGLRAVTERHRADSVRVEFANPCVIVDLNTADDYENALAAFLRGEWGEESEQTLQAG